MMVMPNKEELNIYNTLKPWLILKDDTFSLKDGAPKKVKEMYEIYKQKYGNKV